MRTFRRISLLTALFAAVWAVLPPAGIAQIQIPILDEPSPSPSPTATSTPRSSPTPTSSPTQDGSSGSGSGSSSGSGGTKKQPSSKKTAVDPVVEKGLSLWRERERSPARTTTKLLDLIQLAHEGNGAPAFEEMSAAFGRFPIVGYVWYQDDYGAPRFKPYYSAHEGNDLFAERGTPVIAVVDGYIWRMGSFSRGGNAVWLMGDDGVRYYYGHLHSLSRGLKTGARVRLGDLLGTVGNTGNAVGTYPHVHFEINPGGLGTVNPKPILDRWLTDAETAMVTTIRAARTHTQLNSFGAARWSLLVDLFSEPVGAPPAFWAAGLGGSGGIIAYADVALSELLAMRPWDELVGFDAPAGAGGEDIAPLDPIAAMLAGLNDDVNGFHVH